MKSIIAGDTPEQCFICHAQGQTEVHHMIHGIAGRKTADKEGLTVHLCRRCHIQLHDHGVHDKDLQVIAQEAWERRYIRTETDKEYLAMNERLNTLPMIAREAWIVTVGKSYITEDGRL